MCLSSENRIEFFGWHVNCTDRIVASWKAEIDELLEQKKKERFKLLQSQIAIREIKGFIHRRKKLLLLVPIVMVAATALIAYKLPLKYKSSTTILVQQEETLNPMVRYNLAVALASEERLQSFNEVIYSRTTMNMLIDSLNLDTNIKTPAKREELLARVRSDIHTNLKGSESFTITYYNVDPEKAKKGAGLLAEHFIRMKLKLENQRNQQTVQFFKEKLDELRTVVENREETFSERLREKIERSPVETRTLQSQLEDVQNDIGRIQRGIEEKQQALNIVQSVVQGDRDMDDLLAIDFSQFQGGDELRETLSQYKNISSKYTEQFPKVRQLKQDVYNEAEQIVSSIRSNIYNQQNQLAYLKEQQSEFTNQMQQASVTERTTQAGKMDYDVYRKLYDEMKVKLEQARTTRDLSKNAKNQFVVIDPPIVSNIPAKPNRLFLIIGGVGIGMILGVLSAATAELLDTTVRKPEDLRSFQKPVVAFIPEASNVSNN